jgi:UDP-glucuronate decarboxylase
MKKTLFLGAQALILAAVLSLFFVLLQGTWSSFLPSLVFVVILAVFSFGLLAISSLFLAFTLFIQTLILRKILILLCMFSSFFLLFLLLCIELYAVLLKGTFSFTLVAFLFILGFFAILIVELINLNKMNKYLKYNKVPLNQSLTKLTKETEDFVSKQVYMSDPHKRKNILVTGGAGFLGSHLCRALLEKGYFVTAMDNLFTGSKENIQDFLQNPRFTFIMHDVTKEFWGQYDEIYNLACPASPIHYQRNPVETTKTSYLGMTNVLELALKTGARVFHASTSEVYGDPEVDLQKETYWGNVNPVGIRSCYDEGKRGAETLANDYYREFGVDVRLARIFNTYGPFMYVDDGRVVSNFVVQALSDKDITIYGEGTQSRSFQFYEDLVEGMIKYMEMEREELKEKFSKFKWKAVPILNMGNPNEFTILELAEKVLKLIPQSKSKIIKERPLPEDDPKQRRPDISMAKEILGWEPKIELEEGLQETIAYFKEYLNR